MKKLLVFDILFGIYFTTDVKKLEDIFSDGCFFNWMSGTLCDTTPKYPSLKEFYEALEVILPDAIYELNKTKTISEIQLSMCIDNGDADAILYVSTVEQ